MPGKIFRALFSMFIYIYETLSETSYSRVSRLDVFLPIIGTILSGISKWFLMIFKFTLLQFSTFVCWQPMVLQDLRVMI